MKKFKIGNRLISAKSITDALKIVKMLDSPNTKVKSRDSEIDELTQEEQQAVEDYREAIRNTSNPKLLKIYSHILEEETEHLQELAEAKEVDDACGRMKDDRLSPMTYKKLKELGVRPEQWKKWTQEQANAFIRNKGQKGEEKSEKNNTKSISAPLKNKGNIDYDGIKDIPKGSTIRFEQDVPFYEKDSAANFDMTDDEFKAYMKKLGFKLKNDMWTLPKGTVAKNWSGIQKYSGPTFEINGEEIEINPLEDETVKITWE